MDAPRFYVGIDVASETLAAVLTAGPAQPVAGPLTVANTPDGFSDLAAWLAEHEAAPHQALVCLESTGVYGRRSVGLPRRCATGSTGAPTPSPSRTPLRSSGPCPSPAPRPTPSTPAAS